MSHVSRDVWARDMALKKKKVLQAREHRLGRSRYIACDCVSMKAADLLSPVGKSGFSLITITNRQQCNYQGLSNDFRDLNNGSRSRTALFNSRIKAEICCSLKRNKTPCSFTSAELLGPLKAVFRDHQSNIHAIKILI